MWMSSSEMHGQLDISTLEISMNTLDCEVGRCKERNLMRKPQTITMWHGHQ
jgi:hypothetical protein